MIVTTERVIIFFGLVFGIPIFVTIAGYIGKWLIDVHEDKLKIFKKLMEVILCLLLYLGMCALIAFGIGGN